MDRANLVFLEPPKVKWVNPSDCVDMDCDGHKEILVQDIDGSLTGNIGGSVISKAEYEWNGDPRHGLGIVKTSNNIRHTNHHNLKPLYHLLKSCHHGIHRK